MLARRDGVPGLRGLAAELAMREDFDLDTIADLRLAIEEACAIVLANADPEGLLVCRLLVSSAQVQITVSVRLPDGWEPVVGPLSLRIMRTLSESVDCWTNGENGRRMFHVQLTT
jgi:serine/threonine-protein kinase RsbW